MTAQLPGAELTKNGPGLVRSTIAVWKDRLIWTSPAHETDKSARPAVVLLIAATGRIRVGIGSRSFQGRAFVVGSDVTRTLKAEGGVYSLHLDPVHRMSRHLRDGLLRGCEMVDLSDAVSPALGECVARAVERPESCADSYRTSEIVLNTLFPHLVGVEPIDPRADMAATWLRLHLPSKLDRAELAALCGLSPGRMSHLMTQELGLSPRRYLLWVKMRRAGELFLRNIPLTAVAHEIGFSDSAHLSRVFKNYFGLTPSFLANNRLVSLRFCDKS